MANPIVRRASYGSSSPVVGERGARTRQQIVDVTLELFAERGVHATMVDDIAKAMGISRATLYQYFESKEQIFIELLEESGAAQLRVMRRLGRLGPNADGFDNLHWWLGELGWVYEKYSTMFVQWASADSRKVPLRPLIGHWLDAYSARLASRFVEASVAGIDPVDLAAALWAIAERFNYYRCMGVVGLSDDAAIDNLAVIGQLMAFPATPMSVLASPATAGRAISPRRGGAQNATAPTGAHPDWLPRQGRFADCSDRAFETVRRLLDAAGRQFATSGYHLTNIDQIVTDAGTARGTLYKYFDDKLDLLVTLSRECAEQVRQMSTRLARLTPGPAMPEQLRAWLAGFVDLHHTYAGVFRVWLDHVSHDPAVEDAGTAAAGSLLGASARVLGRVEHQYPLDVRAASLMVVGLLERFPEQAVGTPLERSADQTVETMALVLERSFLNTGEPRLLRRRDRPLVL